jgi:hypothetical protein
VEANVIMFRSKILAPIHDMLTNPTLQYRIWHNMVAVEVSIEDNYEPTADGLGTFVDRVIATGAFGPANDLGVLRFSLRGKLKWPAAGREAKDAFFTNIGRLIHHVARRYVTRDERAAARSDFGDGNTNAFDYFEEDKETVRARLTEAGVHF